MSKPFIRNHQYNLIKKQIGLLQHASNTVSDPRVVDTVRFNGQSKILAAFPQVTDLQKQTLEKFSTLGTPEEYQPYLHSLEPFLEGFMPITEKQIIKLFPKVKKLKVPTLASIDFRYRTYLGWVDIQTNRLYLVYQLNGRFIGIDGRYTAANKGVCFLCNQHGDVALFSANTKVKPTNASPDYYKAIGNYLCVDSDKCNSNITDVTVLEKFIQEVLGQA